MTDNSLLPCPFCGDYPSYGTRVNGATPSNFCYCPHCMSPKYFDLINNAIDAWNTRPVPLNIEDIMDELRRWENDGWVHVDDIEDTLRGKPVTLAVPELKMSDKCREDIERIRSAKAPVKPNMPIK